MPGTTMMPVVMKEGAVIMNKKGNGILGFTMHSEESNAAGPSMGAKISWPISEVDHD